MGLFDSLYIDCPHCGGKVELQSKADADPYLKRYTMENVPRHILEDVINDPVYHERCGNWLALVDKNYPPFATLPMPTPTIQKVKPPADPTKHEQGYQWWPDGLPFGEDCLVDAPDAGKEA